MWNERLAQCGRAYPTGVLTVVEPSGYPSSVRLAAQFEANREVISFPSPPALAAGWQGPACLMFHRHNEVLEDFHELLIRGELVQESGTLTLRPSAFLTGTGRQDTDAMPHAAAPLQLIQFMLLGQRKARAYLQKRGRPWPAIDWDALLRVAREDGPR